MVPVGFEFDGTHFYVGGVDSVKTRKFRNVASGGTTVALVVDDLVSTDPWVPRSLRAYGTAELVERPGQFATATYMWDHAHHLLELQPRRPGFSHDREIVVTRTVHHPTTGGPTP